MEIKKNWKMVRDEQGNKFKQNGRKLNNILESLEIAKRDQYKTVERMLSKKIFKTQQNRRQNLNLGTELATRTSEEPTTKVLTPAHTLHECSTNNKWKFKHPPNRDLFYESKGGKEPKNDLKFEVIFSSENLQNDFKPCYEDSHRDLYDHNSRDLRSINGLIGSDNSLSDTSISDEENPNEKFINLIISKNYSTLKNMECSRMLYDDNYPPDKTSACLMNVNQSSKPIGRSSLKSPISSKFKPLKMKSQTKTGKSEDNIKQEKIKKEDISYSLEDFVKTEIDNINATPDVKESNIKKERSTGKVSSKKKEKTQELTPKSKSEIKKQKLKAEKIKSIEKDLTLTLLKEDTKKENQDPQEVLMPRQKALKMPLATSNPSIPSLKPSPQGSKLKEEQEQMQGQKTIETLPKSTKEDVMMSSSRSIVKDKSISREQKSKELAVTPKISKSTENLMKQQQSKSKELKDERSKSKEKTPEETAEREYLRNLIGGDTKKPIELNHYRSEEFIGSKLNMRGGWRFNINFSELPAEQTKSEVKESRTPVKITSDENPAPEKDTEALNKDQAYETNKNYCQKSCIRATYDQFVSRWKKDQSVQNLFDRKPYTKEIKEKEAEEVILENENNCLPKHIRCTFSVYQSEAKNYGGYDLCLFCAPRACKCGKS